MDKKLVRDLASFQALLAEYIKDPEALPQDKVGAARFLTELLAALSLRAFQAEPVQYQMDCLNKLLLLLTDYTTVQMTLCAQYRQERQKSLDTCTKPCGECAEAVQKCDAALVRFSDPKMREELERLLKSLES